MPDGGQNDRPDDGRGNQSAALGHNGAAWQEQDYREHILGAIEWASGEEPGDCGEPRDGLPTDASFDKVTLGAASAMRPGWRRIGGVG